MSDIITVRSGLIATQENIFEVILIMTDDTIFVLEFNLN